MQNLRPELEKLIKRLPKPRNNPICSICGDTGWEVITDNEYEAVRPCVCKRNELKPSILSATGIPSSLWRCTLDSFKLYINNKSLRAAVELSREFLDSYPAVRKGMLFTGVSGCGKTHLAVAICMNLAIEKGVRVHYLNFGELLEGLRERYDNSEMNHTLLSDAMEAEVLLLDDLGATRATEWARDILRIIVHGRQKQTRRYLIATTVFPDKAPTGQIKLTDRISEPLRSLLFELCRTITIDAPDYRREVLSMQ